MKFFEASWERVEIWDDIKIQGILKNLKYSDTRTYYYEKFFNKNFWKLEIFIKYL